MTTLKTVPDPSPQRLWIAMRVAPYEATVEFYRDALGLTQVDGWHDGESRGVVFAIGDSARLEIESADATGPPPYVALEMPDRAALNALHRRLESTTPVATHARGHSWFTTHDPSGTEIYLWSEK